MDITVVADRADNAKNIAKLSAAERKFVFANIRAKNSTKLSPVSITNFRRFYDEARPWRDVSMQDVAPELILRKLIQIISSRDMCLDRRMVIVGKSTQGNLLTLQCPRRTLYDEDEPHTSSASKSTADNSANSAKTKKNAAKRSEVKPASAIVRSAAENDQLPVGRILLSNYKSITTTRAPQYGDDSMWMPIRSHALSGKFTTLKISLGMVGWNSADQIADIFRAVISLSNAADSAGALIAIADEFASAKSPRLRIMLSPYHDTAVAQLPNRTAVYSAAEKLVLAEYLGGALSRISNSIAVADIIRWGLFPTFCHAVAFGVDDDKTAVSLATYRTDHAQRTFTALANKERIGNFNSASSLVRIIRQLYGRARTDRLYASLEKLGKKTPTIADIFAALTPDESKPVKLEHARQEQYAKSARDNTCKHAGIVRKLRRTGQIYQRRGIFEALKTQYLDPTDASKDEMNCRVCDFFVMCPHYYTFCDAGWPLRDVLKLLDRYVATRATDGTHHCKLCGEDIAVEIIDTNVVIPQDNFDASLREWIWNEVVSMAKYIDLSGIANAGRALGQIRDNLYPLIEAINTQLDKSRSNTREEIYAKKRVFAGIYTLAYFVRLMEKYPNIKWRSDTPHRHHKKSVAINKTGGGESGAGAGKSAAELLRAAMDIIVNDKNIWLRVISNFGKDVIRAKLVDAYKIVKVSEITKTDNKDTIAEANRAAIYRILNDPLYDYHRRLWLIHLRQSSAAKINRDTAWKHIFSADPRAVPTISDAKLPPMHQWKFANGEYIRESIRYCLQRPVGAVFGIRGKPPQMQYTKSRVTYNTDWKNNILPLETAALAIKRQQYARAQGVPFFGTTRPRAESSFRRLYDAAGRKHDYSTLLLADGREMPLKSYITEMATVGSTYSKAVDRRCTICKCLKSTGADTTDDVILAQLAVIRRRLNILQWYDLKCPRGILHRMPGNNTNNNATTITMCEACGFKRNMTDKEAAEYCQKYGESFDAALQNGQTDGFDAAESTSVAAQSTVAPPQTSAELYVEDFGIIVGLGDRLKISHNLLAALGAIDPQTEYSDVTSGKFTPVDPSERYSSRSFRVAGYLRAFALEYNQFRNSSKLPVKRLPYYIGKIIHGANRADLEALGGLPSVLGDFGTTWEILLKSGRPREILGYCIQQLCISCDTILEACDEKRSKLPSHIAKMGREWITQFMANLLRGEELLSKPGHFSWRDIFGNPNGPSNSAKKQLRGEDIDEPVNNDPFDLDAYDVEESGAPDDDDPSNQVKVEGYGF